MCICTSGNSRDSGFALRTPRNDKPYFVTASISAKSSALSVQSIAWTFCSTCSTRVAPAITLETCGRDASHGTPTQASCGRAAVRRPAFLDNVFVARRDIAVAQQRDLAEARVYGGCGAALVFAGQQTAGEREERQQAEFVFLPPAEDPFRCRALRGCIRPGTTRTGYIDRSRAVNSASAMRQAGKFELPM